MNASLEKVFKNLSDDYYKYLTEELGSKNLDLLKQKDSYPYEYTDSFKRWNHQICNEMTGLRLEKIVNIDKKRNFLHC